MLDFVLNISKMYISGCF